jgi:phosphatidylglycerol---prolipoprotein diacylglyceryl transferase
MYPLVSIGPFRLSSAGLVLLISLIVGGWLSSRSATARGGATLARQADTCFYPVLIGAVLGARLWYGVFNLDLYGRTPHLFVALRVSDFAWPGALLGGVLAGYLCCRWNGFDHLKLADSAVLALPVTQALASMGLLLSGEACGVPTTLPWGVPIFGTIRHPTQLYLALAALISLGILARLARRSLPTGALAMIYLGLNGITLLLIEALRADSLVFPGGIRAAQVFGLGLLLYALSWFRQQLPAPDMPPAVKPLPPESQRQS